VWFLLLYQDKWTFFIKKGGNYRKALFMITILQKLFVIVTPEAAKPPTELWLPGQAITLYRSTNIFVSL
jgi:hypothetical protein